MFSLGSVIFGCFTMAAGVMRSFLGCLARQRPVSYNREVFSLGSVLRTRYHGKIVLLVRPELQEGEVGRSRHA
jgi:hypothetical protein